MRNNWRSISYPGGPEQIAEYEWLDDLCAEYVKRESATRLAIEIGAWKGRATALLAQYFYVYTIDTWNVEDFSGPLVTRGHASSQLAFHKNMERLKLQKRICPICGDSTVLYNFPYLGAGIIFIDGDHSKESCLDDIRNCGHHLANDGLMVVHDWKRCDPDPWYGVAEAVNEVLFLQSYEIVKSRPGICALKRRR